MVNRKKLNRKEIEEKRREIKVPMPITSSPEEFARQSFRKRVENLIDRKAKGLSVVSKSFEKRQAQKKYGYVTIDKEKITELAIKNEKLLRIKIPELENVSEVAIIISSLESQETKGRILTPSAKERLAYAYDYLKEERMREERGALPKDYMTHPNALVYEFFDNILNKNTKWKNAKDTQKKAVLMDLVEHKMLSEILTDNNTFNYWVNRLTKKYGL